MEYLVRRHTSLLGTNWLAGDRAATREIVRDCWKHRGARLRCVGWSLLSMIPHPCVRAPWMLWRWMAGRRPIAPQVRSILRVPGSEPGASATPQVLERRTGP
jgi:hypothetical protein